MRLKSPILIIIFASIYLFIYKDFSKLNDCDVCKAMNIFVFIPDFVMLTMCIFIYNKYKFSYNMAYVYPTILLIIASDIIWYVLRYDEYTRYFQELLISDVIIFIIWNLIIITYIVKSLGLKTSNFKTHWFITLLLVAINIVLTLSSEVSSLHDPAKPSLYIFFSWIVTIISVSTFELVLISLIFCVSDWIYMFFIGILFMISGDFLILSRFSWHIFFPLGRFSWVMGVTVLAVSLYQLISLKTNNVVRKTLVLSNSFRNILTLYSLIVGLVNLIFIFIILYSLGIVSYRNLSLMPICITFSSLILFTFFNELFYKTENQFYKIRNLIDKYTNREKPEKYNFNIVEFGELQNFIVNAFDRIKLLNEDKINLQEENHVEKIKNINESNKYHELLLKKRLLENLAKKDKQYRDNLSLLVHDIKSPISLINSIVIQSKKNNVLESYDIDALEFANKRIHFLTCRLLEDYKLVDGITQKLYFNVYLRISEIIFEFKIGYSSIKFDFLASDYVKLSLLFGMPESLDRILVNLIDNAVIATKNHLIPQIIVKLENEHDMIKISVKDNGVGITKEVRQKLLAGENIESTKINGSGVGLLQVCQTINNFGGKYEIISEIGIGTEFIITIPQYKQPQWFLREINLKHGQHIVILDDDVNIHALWKKVFFKYIERLKLNVNTFEKISELQLFLKEINYEQIADILFLCDYDLNSNDHTGVDVIKLLGIKNSILVTSNAENHEIQNTIANYRIKMLDKQIISYIEIKEDYNSKVVDMVWVDDEDFFPKYIVKKAYKNLNVDIYKDPRDFLNNIDNYPKETKIILDMYYELSDQTIYNKNGVDLAKILHDIGYTDITLLSGEAPEIDVPTYVQVILKNSQEVLLLNKWK